MSTRVDFCLVRHKVLRNKQIRHTMLRAKFHSPLLVAPLLINVFTPHLFERINVTSRDPAFPLSQQKSEQI